jgi:hypothetical protein
MNKTFSELLVGFKEVDEDNVFDPQYYQGQLAIRH